MEAEHVFAALVVAEIDAGVAWYTRLLGRPPDIVPNGYEAIWRLADSASFYVLADPARAGRGALTVAVADLDACVAGLSDRGIEPGPVDQVHPGARKAEVVDPDGNTVALIEVTAAS